MKSAQAMRGKLYYREAQKGSEDFTHPGMQALVGAIENTDKVLDVGCGEGTRLAGLCERTGVKKAYGTDINKLAISLAKKRYPKLTFTQSPGEHLPYKDNSFDLVYSAYVFEHLVHPKEVFIEMVRVTKPGGSVVIIAPNFGSPNRRSPNSVESKIKKLVVGFFKDFFRADLTWTAVTPQKNVYTMDADTTVEPYLLTLVRYATQNGLVVQQHSSCWEADTWTLFQTPFRVLGQLRIFPFMYWGPHLYVIAKKREM